MSHSKNRPNLKTPREKTRISSTQLDEEFRIMLLEIRPYILRLESPKILNLCCVWLRALESSQDKRSRNKIMNELFQQIKRGRLSEPFLELPEMKDELDRSSDSWTDITESTRMSYKYIQETNDNLKKFVEKSRKILNEEVCQTDSEIVLEHKSGLEDNKTNFNSYKGRDNLSNINESLSKFNMNQTVSANDINKMLSKKPSPVDKNTLANIQHNDGHSSKTYEEKFEKKLLQEVLSPNRTESADAVKNISDSTVSLKEFIQSTKSSQQAIKPSLQSEMSLTKILSQLESREMLEQKVDGFESYMKNMQDKVDNLEKSLHILHERSTGKNKDFAYELTQIGNYVKNLDEASTSLKISYSQTMSHWKRVCKTLTQKLSTSKTNFRQIQNVLEKFAEKTQDLNNLSTVVPKLEQKIGEEIQKQNVKIEQKIEDVYMQCDSRLTDISEVFRENLKSKNDILNILDKIKKMQYIRLQKELLTLSADPAEKQIGNAKNLNKKISELENVIVKTKKNNTKLERVLLHQIKAIKSDKAIHECALEMQMIIQRAKFIANTSDVKSTGNEMVTHFKKYSELLASQQVASLATLIKHKEDVEKIDELESKYSDIKF